MLVGHEVHAVIRYLDTAREALMTEANVAFATAGEAVSRGVVDAEAHPGKLRELVVRHADQRSIRVDVGDVVGGGLGGVPQRSGRRERDEVAVEWTELAVADRVHLA